LEAILLVGGEGTRLRPLTITTPKPMLPVAGVPLVVHQLLRARDVGVDRVVLATSYKAEVFRTLGDGAALGLRIDYVVEDEPLGTGGGIRNASAALTTTADEPVFVFNGDVLSGHDLSAQLRRHVESGAVATLHLTEVDDPRAYGCVPLDQSGRVTAFLEKAPEPVSNLINAGCYVLSRQLIESIPAGRPVSVERETFPGVLDSGELVLGYVEQAYWLDLGTPEAFVRGSRDVVLGALRSPTIPGDPAAALVADGADVSASATITGGSYIAAGARVGDEAVVDGSVLFEGAQVGSRACVRNSALGRGAVVAEQSEVDSCVLGDGSVLGRRNQLLHGARLWPGAHVADGALRFSPDR
jgi:mannose-1-phosphate guanylyltransferase